MHSLSSSAQEQELGTQELLDTHQLVNISEYTSRQPSPTRTVLKSPPKNGVPPKRLSTTAKRTSPSLPSVAPRANASATSRGAPGTGLSKPPTRPSISSTVRRPAVSVTAATAASTGHRKRPSVASNELNSVKRGDASGSEENIKPSSSKPDTRRNLHDRGDLRNVIQIGHADNLNHAAKLEQSAASGRTNITSPMKSVLRSTTNGSRPSSMHSTSRSTRPMASSTGGLSQSDAAKKRLSTIPASPAPAKPETALSENSILPVPVNSTRPGLLSRKSTMSVTIEQRLKEMELVHQMLHIAMAKDGDEDDEVKEEYGRKVDESLASLRLRLEEARQNEGIVPRESEANGASGVQSSDAKINQAMSSHNKLSEALHESERKVGFCRENPTFQSTELTTVLQVSALNHEISDLQQRLNQATSSVTNTEELNLQRDASIQQLQGEIQRLHETQAQKINELSKKYQIDLAAAHAENLEAEVRHNDDLARSVQEQADAILLTVSESSKEAVSKLESEVNAYTSELQAVELDLAIEKKDKAAAVTSLGELQLEISSLRNQLSEQRQTLADTRRSWEDRYTSVLKQREDMLMVKEQHILDLQRKIQGLQSKQSLLLEEVERVSLSNRHGSESELTAAREKLSELESSYHSVVSSHEEELSEKDREIKGLAIVIEEFQSKMQNLHELKERAVDETRLDLIEEHEKILSDHHRKHRDEIAELALQHEQELQNLRLEHDNALEFARANNAKDVTRMEELLRASEESNHVAELAIAEGRDINAALTVQVASLEFERDEIKASKTVTDDAFKRASDEITGLKKTLETRDVDTADKDNQYTAAIRKIEEELVGTTKALEERSAEAVSTLQGHTEEMSRLIARHAGDVKALESKSHDALLELQEKHDVLLAKWNQAETARSKELEELEVLKAELRTAQRQAEVMEHLQTTHAKEAQGNLDQVKKTHERDVSTLVEYQDRKYESLRQELDLAEEQLQQFKDSMDGAKDLAQQFEVLKSQLADSQAEIGQANAEISRMTIEVEEARKAVQDTTELDQLRYEMFELTQKHAAEIFRVQGAAALEDERRSKERKQGAEVRDRLVNETDKLSNELVAAKLQAEKHLNDLELSMAQTQEAVNKNAASFQAAERHKDDYRKATDELKVVRAEFEKLKRESSQARKESSPMISQELEALQMAADAEREQNRKLKEQVREAQAAVERQATKLREVESALKVTTAELVEAQTVRPYGSEYSASPAPKSGLRSSRWAVTDVADQTDGERGEDENLGPSIEGMVGSLFPLVL